MSNEKVKSEASNDENCREQTTTTYALTIKRQRASISKCNNAENASKPAKTHKNPGMTHV